MVDVVLLVVVAPQQRPSLLRSIPTLSPTKRPFRLLPCPRRRLLPIEHAFTVKSPCLPRLMGPRSVMKLSASQTVPTSDELLTLTRPLPGTRTLAAPALRTRVALPA